MRKFAQSVLASSAKRLLAREKPAVIAVTGSVGKSSAKEAIAAVLRSKFPLWATPGNYNTEFGVPLAILGLTLPKSKFGWPGTLWRAWMRSLTGIPEYPKTLVLEMGADRPGDIARLCAIAPPDVAVVTAVGESHMEAFGSTESIQKEKRALVERMAKDGVAVLNRDDEKVWEMRAKAKGKTVSFGFHEEADVRAVGPIGYACDFGGECGMHFKVTAGGATVPMFVPGSLGQQSVYAALAAAAVGLERGMNLVDIGDGLRGYGGLPGRMRYVPGIKRTMLIDDTYNAAPRSMLAALYVLREIPIPESAKRYAVLGDMLELGSISESAHLQVGREAAESADVLVFVGERMNDAARGAREAGAGDDRVYHFSTTEEAGRFVQERLKEHDVVLVKGSRGMKMEYVVKELMAEPQDAPTTLVGHHEEWKF